MRIVTRILVRNKISVRIVAVCLREIDLFSGDKTNRICFLISELHE